MARTAGNGCFVALHLTVYTYMCCVQPIPQDSVQGVPATGSRTRTPLAGNVVVQRHPVRVLLPDRADVSLGEVFHCGELEDPGISRWVNCALHVRAVRDAVCMQPQYFSLYFSCHAGQRHLKNITVSLSQRGSNHTPP